MRNTVKYHARLTLTGVALAAVLPWQSVVFAQPSQPGPAPLSAPLVQTPELPAPPTIEPEPETQPAPVPGPAAKPTRSTPARPAAPLQPGEGITQISNPYTKFRMRVLDSRVLETVNRIRMVDGFDENLIKVQAISPHRIRLLADTAGVTNLKLIDEFDITHNVEIFVEPDTRELQAYLERLFPASAIEVVGIKDAVVLRGSVTQPSHIPEIVEVAQQFYHIVQPQLTVSAPSMVQLKVEVIEIQRSKIETFGVNFTFAGKNYFVHNGVGSISNLTKLTTGIGTIPGAELTGKNSNMNFAITGRTDAFRGFIEALRQESLAEIKASPVLVTNSGFPATFKSGGEFPILVAQGLGNNSVQWRDYGVSVQFVPLVLGQGRLRLEVYPTVSERDFSINVESNGIVTPSLTSRSVHTQVEMKFGETLMIGGMIFEKEIRNSSKIPFLGELPWVGAAFSRKMSELGETELLILVTPQMAAPMKDYEVPAVRPGDSNSTPTFKEYIFDGSMEVPNFGPDCPNGDCGQEVHYSGLASKADSSSSQMITARKPSANRESAGKIQQASRVETYPRNSAIHASMESTSGKNPTRATTASGVNSREAEYDDSEYEVQTETPQQSGNRRQLPGMIQPKAGAAK